MKKTPIIALCLALFLSGCAAPDASEPPVSESAFSSVSSSSENTPSQSSTKPDLVTPPDFDENLPPPVRTELSDEIWDKPAPTELDRSAPRETAEFVISYGQPWEYYFSEASQLKLVRLMFDPLNASVELGVGYYESEWDFYKSGTYRISDDMILVHLDDASDSIDLSFSAARPLRASTDADAETVLTLLSCSRDLVTPLIGRPLLFTVYDPDPQPVTFAHFEIPESFGEDIVTLSMNAPAELNPKGNVLLNLAGLESFRFHVVKKGEEDAFLALHSRENPPQELPELAGKTDEGCSYRVYRRTRPLNPGTRETSFVVLIDTQKGFTQVIEAIVPGISENVFYSMTVLPSVRSVSVRV